MPEAEADDERFVVQAVGVVQAGGGGAGAQDPRVHARQGPERRARGEGGRRHAGAGEGGVEVAVERPVRARDAVRVHDPGVEGVHQVDQAALVVHLGVGGEQGHLPRADAAQVGFHREAPGVEAQGAGAAVDHQGGAVRPHGHGGVALAHVQEGDAQKTRRGRRVEAQEPRQAERGRAQGDRPAPGVAPPEEDDKARGVGRCEQEQGRRRDPRAGAGQPGEPSHEREQAPQDRAHDARHRQGAHGRRGHGGEHGEGQDHGAREGHEDQVRQEARPRHVAEVPGRQGGRGEARRQGHDGGGDDGVPHARLSRRRAAVGPDGRGQALDGEDDGEDRREGELERRRPGRPGVPCKDAEGGEGEGRGGVAAPSRGQGQDHEPHHHQGAQGRRPGPGEEGVGGHREQGRPGGDLAQGHPAGHPEQEARRQQPRPQADQQENRRRHQPQVGARDRQEVRHARGLEAVAHVLGHAPRVPRREGGEERRLVPGQGRVRRGAHPCAPAVQGGEGPGRGRRDGHLRPLRHARPRPHPPAPQVGRVVEAARVAQRRDGSQGRVGGEALAVGRGRGVSIGGWAVARHPHGARDGHAPAVRLDALGVGHEDAAAPLGEGQLGHGGGQAHPVARVVPDVVGGHGPVAVGAVQRKEQEHGVEDVAEPPARPDEEPGGEQQAEGGDGQVAHQLPRRQPQERGDREGDDRVVGHARSLPVAWGRRAGARAP